MEDTIKVDSAEGLYDEKAEAVNMNIVNIKRCWKHDFLNGSLRWEPPHAEDAKSYYSINLEAQKNPHFNPEWGTGYGGIRYCRNCKQIDCIHIWEDEIKEYEIEHGKYYSVHFTIKTCQICKRRVYIGGGGHCKPSTEAWEVIHEATALLGKPEIGINSPYGSGFMCEFPVAVARIIDTQGREAGKQYALGILSQGDCSSSMSSVHG